MDNNEYMEKFNKKLNEMVEKNGLNALKDANLVIWQIMHGIYDENEPDLQRRLCREWFNKYGILVGDE